MITSHGIYRTDVLMKGYKMNKEILIDMIVSLLSRFDTKTLIYIEELLHGLAG